MKTTKLLLVALVSCGSTSAAAPTASVDGGGTPAQADGGVTVDAAPSGDAASSPTDSAAPGADAAADVKAPVEAAAPPPPNPCVDAGTCPPGTWINITPAAVDLVDALDCSNFGVASVQVDPNAPADIYIDANCQGIWKSTDYGTTWTGPINTGTNGSTVGDSAGSITIAAGPPGMPPVIYSAAIRGSGIGLWKSTDGGSSWTNYVVAPAGSRQDMYAPAVDPYDGRHLLMAGHEQDMLVESTDGGMTWTRVTLDPGMNENGGTGAIFFLDTGLSFSTRVTWLWMAQSSGGTYGTWRTSDEGMTWTQVDTNEHPHGAYQIYQPDPGGVVYMAGIYSKLGWGVLRSTDYGQTWTHVGGTAAEAVVFGTPSNVYSMWGWAIGEGNTLDPSLEIVPQPGTGTWAPTMTPAALTQGPAQVAMTSDGTHAIAIAACFNAGVWRYVEP